MWLVWSGGAGVLWLLSGSVLPGHLPRQDGNSNRARSTVRKISDAHHYWYQCRDFSEAKLRNTKLCFGQKQCSGFFLMNNNDMMLSKYFYSGMMLSKYFCNVMMLLKYFLQRDDVVEVLMIQKPQYPFSVVQFALSQTFNEIGIKPTTWFPTMGSEAF